MSSHVAGTNINKLRFDLDAEAIKNQTDDLLADFKKVFDSVASLESDKHTFDNTVKPIAGFEPIFDVTCSNFTFPAHTSTDKVIRDASTNAQKSISAFAIEQSMREDVYKAVMEYTKKGDKLTPQDQRFLDRVVRNFKRNGLHLPEQQRNKIKDIKKQISDLCIQFQKNVNENTDSVQLTSKQLEGLPESVLKQLKVEQKDGQTYHTVTMKYPDIVPALKYVKDVEARKLLEISFTSRCKVENTSILEQVVALRDELAKLLGYSNHSEFVLEIRMAKSPQNVKDFYSTLLPKLQALARKELEVMLNYKKEELGAKSDNKINGWDYNYYDRMTVEKLYSVDDEKIKEYFPLEKVVKSTLEIYQELLGLRFKELSGVHVWHSEVQSFEVRDKVSDELIGYFYMDLFPRDGKYSHAAAFSLQKGCNLGDGSWQYPTSAMVCNFVKPQPDSPSLLKHSEVETFFHEFGHIMHGLCAKAKHSRFAGTSTERDFVECPSQMLENWCWDKDLLKRISSHYKTNEPLPSDLIDKMIASKNANSGLFNLRQMFYGMFDQTVHSQAKSENIAEIYNKLRKEIALVEGTQGTNGSASFGHIVGGYGASYYGYLWSKVFSSDMFELFEKKGIMSPEMGKLYRDKILAPGGSKDGDEILRDFLGRDPVMDPFMRSIGLN